MAQQTINVGTSPNDGTGTPLRTAFQYTNSNFSELYTAVGPSGNNIVVPGTATITGDLTVDTSTLKVDSANNGVGIGTATPTSYGAGYSVLEVAGSTTGVINVKGGSTVYGQVSTEPNILKIDAPGASSVLKVLTNSVERYRIDNTGISTWYVGGSTAMTLNSTGLGVGAGPGLTGSSRRALTVNAPTGQLSILELAVNSVTTGYLFSNATQTSLVSQGATFLTFDTNSNERMRIDSSGNVGVGVTPYASWPSTSRALQLGASSAIEGRTNDGSRVTLYSNTVWNGTNLIYQNTAVAACYQQAVGVHSWHTSNNTPSAGNTATFTQAMTLDTSGNLLVGKTAIGTTVGIEARPDGYFIATRSESTNVAAFTNAVYSTGASAYRFYVGMGGTVYATNTTISAISDARFKENVQDIDVGLGAILALKPRKFDWKDGKGKNIKGDRGFIAQEFEQVFPQLVDEWADPSPEGEAPYKSVRQDLIPVLVKAIQELTARVEALEA